MSGAAHQGPHAAVEAARTFRDLIKAGGRAAGGTFPQRGETKRGRPAKAAVALARVAESTGIPEETLRRAKAQADAVDAQPRGRSPARLQCSMKG